MSWKVVQNFQTEYQNGNVRTICNSSPPSWNLELIELVLVFFCKPGLLSKCWNDQSEQNLLSDIFAQQFPSRTGSRRVELVRILSRLDETEGKTEIVESYRIKHCFITWLCDNFTHVFTYLYYFICLFVSLFPYFFISLYLYLSIYSFVLHCFSSLNISSFL